MGNIWNCLRRQEEELSQVEFSSNGRVTDIELRQLEHVFEPRAEDNLEVEEEDGNVIHQKTEDAEKMKWLRLREDIELAARNKSQAEAQKEDIKDEEEIIEVDLEEQEEGGNVIQVKMIGRFTVSELEEVFDRAENIRKDGQLQEFQLFELAVSQFHQQKLSAMWANEMLQQLQQRGEE